jgi:hypothetical protein
MFLHPVGSAGHIVHSDASGARNVDALFCMLRWGRYGFQNKHARTHYAELVFFNLMESPGHVVHFGASRAPNVNTLFFILRWARYGFQKKHVGTCYTKLVFIHLVGSMVPSCIPTHLGHHMSTLYFSCSGLPTAVSIKSPSGHVVPNMCFCIR